MSQLEDRLMEDYKEAMRAGDSHRKETVRLLRAAVKSAEIDKRAPLSEAEVIDVLTRQAKQRRDSIEQFTLGGRQDLVDSERYELSLIESYLPQQASREEIEAAARDVIAALGLSGPRAMGQAMGKLVPMFKGKADGKLISDVVAGLLRQP